jgi:alpha-glucuronidase
VSEEKNLTDEATIDSLKEMAIKFSENTYVNRVLVNAINLMQDLQEENKSFAKTINKASDTLRNQRAKIEQLKINLANEKKWGKIQTKQAEKDTARKIWNDCIEKIMRGCGDDKEFWVVKILIKTFKKYEVGFEVDYEN